MPEKIQGPARAATHHPRGRPTATPPTVPMARQPPPPAGVAGGPRVSSRAIKPPRWSMPPAEPEPCEP